MGVYDIKQPSKFNTLNIMLALAGITIGYLGWWFLPHWYPVFTLSGIMHSTCNDAYRITDDEKLMAKLVKDGRRTGISGLTPENFKLWRDPWTIVELNAMGVTEEASVRMMQARGKMCHLEFDYTAHTTWPISGKVSEIHFHRSVENDLKTIQY